MSVLIFIALILTVILILGTLGVVTYVAWDDLSRLVGVMLGLVFLIAVLVSIPIIDFGHHELIEHDGRGYAPHSHE